MQVSVPFEIEPFVPPFYLRNPHVQTIGGRLLQRLKPVDFERVRLDTPDGDFVDVDMARLDDVRLSSDAPVMLFMHGLEGNARRGYARMLYRALADAGIRSVGLNYRSCSGELNRTAKFYHLGATDDVVTVHDWLETQFPEVPKVLVGVSLGANILLKYLGEGGEAMQQRITAAVAISPPFDPTGRQKLGESRISRLYGRWFVRALQHKVRQKPYLIQAAGGDVPAAMRAITLKDFDNAITAPIHGFRDADDYYARCAAVNFLPHIRVPTLLLRSLDDPFFNDYDVPFDIIRASPWLYNGIVPCGGHAGFMAQPFRQVNWSAHQTRRFLTTMLHQAVPRIAKNGRK